jgi:hypothetical protein
MLISKKLRIVFLKYQEESMNSNCVLFLKQTLELYKDNVYKTELIITILRTEITFAINY